MGAEDDARERAERALRVLAIVPARLESSRLPRKMLLAETGTCLFAHTVENVARVPAIERVVLATDSEAILAAAAEVGVEALITSSAHTSGTDRVHEAAKILLERGDGPWDVIVNVQGDEPELPIADVEALIGAFRDPEVELATLQAPLSDVREAHDASVVKVVVDANGDALYFSRAPIPSLAHPRRAAEREGTPGGAAENATGIETLRRHVGVYAFRPAALARFCSLPPGRLERIESLEQLRWLEAGLSLRVVDAAQTTVGIDTPEDYALFVERQNARSGPPEDIQTP